MSSLAALGHRARCGAVRGSLASLPPLLLTTLFYGWGHGYPGAPSAPPTSAHQLPLFHVKEAADPASVGGSLPLAVAQEWVGGFPMNAPAESLAVVGSLQLFSQDPPAQEVQSSRKNRRHAHTVLDVTSGW